MSAIAAPLNPQPISAALKKHFEEELASIKTGGQGQVGFAVTTTGAQLGAAYRKGHFELAGWVGREWTSDWLAGVKGTFHF